jgi:hypothetical protein
MTMDPATLTALCAPRPCRICGCKEVRVDEVYDRGLVRLAECPRCEDRTVEWVVAPARAPLRAVWAAREAAEAA